MPEELLLNVNHLHTYDIMFGCLLSFQRQCQIKESSCDVKSTRSQRTEIDKFAFFSTIWDRFIDNCQSCYKPGSDITIYEQLFPTKSGYPFTQYMASKLDKFGIKFWLAVDSKSNYLLNGFPYFERNADHPQNQLLLEYVVLKLAGPKNYKVKNKYC